MPGIFAIFFNVCLPLLLVIATGWMLDRKFDFDLRSLVKLNIYLFVPAFILVRLSTSTLPGKTGAMVMIFTLCVILTMGILSWVISRLSGYPPEERAALQLGTMIYNSGNWGIPLMALAFPGEGGVIQVFVLATMNMTTFTLGVVLANSARKEREVGWRNLLPILKQPSIYAITAAICFRIFGNPLEEVVFVWKPLSYLADALVGFALLTLGVQLSKTRPPRPAGRMGWALGIRLLAGPAAAIVLTYVFGLEGTLAATLILGAASPTAVNTALLAHEFGADFRFSSSVVYYSTIAATAVVTILLAVLHGGGIPWAVPG